MIGVVSQIGRSNQLAEINSIIPLFRVVVTLFYINQHSYYYFEAVIK